MNSVSEWTRVDRAIPNFVGTSAQRPGRRLVHGPMLWLLPSMIVLVMISLYPLVYALFNSFRYYNISTGAKPSFIGLANYLAALLDEEFLHSLGLSLIFAVAATAAEVGLGLAIAVLLNRELRCVRMVRSLLIMPVAIAPAVAGLAFRSLYDPSSGAIPFILRSVGVTPPAAGILGDGSTALAGLITTEVWQWTPFAALVFLAAMQGVPKSLLEAAQVDGARPTRVFRSIVLPLMGPIVVVVVLLRFIATFNIFDIVYVETRGGPGFSTTVSGLVVYQEALEHYDIGYASALTWIMIIIVAILINVYFLTTRKTRR